MNRYYVCPCDEGDGRRTWDVLRRHSHGTNDGTVGNYDTRSEARKSCAEYNSGAVWSKAS